MMITSLENLAAETQREFELLGKKSHLEDMVLRTPGISEKRADELKTSIPDEVDAVWISHFPEHQPFLGNGLVHHHIDHGHLTTALPTGLHGKAPGNAMFHDNLGGKK